MEEHGISSKGIPAVSVVICHHTGDLIHRCLESVFASQSAFLDVIVVSSDPNFRVLNDYAKGQYVQQAWSTDGPAHKRNMGVRLSRAPEYIAFLDDDVEISPYCLWYMVKGLRDNDKAGMVYAKILNMERRDEFDDAGSFLTWTGFLWARAGNNQKDKGQFNSPCEILASKSATCMVRKSAFLDAGGFDRQNFILGEETDLSWRMWLKGWQVWYFPDAVSWHAFNTKFKPREKFYTNNRIFFMGCRNYINMLITNLGAWRLLSTLPVHISIWLVSAVGFAIRGHWRRSGLILKGAWWNLTHLRQTLKKRRQVQSGRKISDRDLMKFIQRNPKPSYFFGRLKRYVTQGLHGALIYAILRICLTTGKLI